MFQAGLWLVLGLGTVWPGRPGGPLTDLRPDSEDPNASNRRKAHLKNTAMMQKQIVTVLYQRRRASKRIWAVLSKAKKDCPSAMVKRALSCLDVRDHSVPTSLELQVITAKCIDCTGAPLAVATFHDCPSDGAHAGEVAACRVLAMDDA